MCERFAILADDLTGAGDSGVEFARAGLRTRALLETWRAGALEGSDVVVVNTESRALAAASAYSRVRAAAERLKSSGVEVIFKKVDSTLRGPIGAEVEAVMDACDSELAILCPAFPANGRSVVDGRLLVDGRPVTSTAIARDPVTPVHESHIPTLLAGQVQRPIHQVGRQALEMGVTTLALRLRSLRGGLVVCDAMSESDLSVLAAATFQAGLRSLYVGSGGLAQPVAVWLAAQQEREAPALSIATIARAATMTAAGHILVVCGSLNAVTRAQISHFLAQSDVRSVLVDGAAVLGGNPVWPAWRERTVRELSLYNLPGGALLIMTPGAFVSSNLTPATVARLLAEAAAELVTQILEAWPVCGVVVTGGDMAAALLEQWEATGIDLVDEVAPGIPLGMVFGGRHAGLAITTKAGGFGKPDALVRAVQKLRAMS